MLDLLWEISHTGNSWQGTLRSDRSVVVSANNGEKLARLLGGLTIGLLTQAAGCRDLLGCELRSEGVVRPLRRS
jgi:hypothetical protein